MRVRTILITAHLLREPEVGVSSLSRPARPELSLNTLCDIVRFTAGLPPVPESLLEPEPSPTTQITDV